MQKAGNTQKDVSNREKDVLQWWKQQKITEHAMSENRGVNSPEFRLCDSPPVVSLKPNAQSLPAYIINDVFARYKARRGFNIKGATSWNAHGFCIEREAKKQLGMTDDNDFDADAFSQRCRTLAERAAGDWAHLLERMGCFVPNERETSSIETVWRVLHELNTRHLLQKSPQVMAYCSHCKTTLSPHETHLDWNNSTEPPALLLRFPIKDEKGLYFLVRADEPWTLLGNAALAVAENATYIEVAQNDGEDGTERLILAEAAAPRVLQGEYEIVRTFKGSELAGKRYLPLYNFLSTTLNHALVVATDRVRAEEGTGVVHLAPAFDNAAFQLAKQNNLAIFGALDDNGYVNSLITQWRGMAFFEANPFIADELTQRGLVYATNARPQATRQCWACGTRTFPIVEEVWHIAASQNPQPKNDEAITWLARPETHEIFNEHVQKVDDWAISRAHFWGTPLPLWQCDACGQQEWIGSATELASKTGVGISALNLQRPAVDALTWTCASCGQAGKMRRVPDVTDTWFDHAALFIENASIAPETDELEIRFFADLVAESNAQITNWVWMLNTLTRVLLNQTAVRHAIPLGKTADNAGQFLEWARENALNTWDIINTHGADALRWHFVSGSALDDDRTLGVGRVGDAARALIEPVLELADLFANASKRGGNAISSTDSTFSEYERSMLSQLETLTKTVTASLDAYDILQATSAIQTWIQEVHKNYAPVATTELRHNNPARTQAIFHTLHQTMSQLSALLAPFTPFLAEHVHQLLTEKTQTPSRLLSIHLSAWPTVEEETTPENRE